jgi:uncharacterized membrane protein HdeD (DUF308 family)
MNEYGRGQSSWVAPGDRIAHQEELRCGPEVQKILRFSKTKPWSTTNEKEMLMSSPLFPAADRPFVGLFHVGLHELRRNWGWFLALGVIMVVVGTAALVYSVVATITAVILFGWLLLIDGILQGVMAFWTRQWSGFFLHVLAGVLSVIVGLILVTNPAEGAVTLTLLLAVFFMVGGLFRIITPLVMQFPTWGWSVLVGVIDVVLGLLIWNRWPWDGLWVIGTFVGIGLIFRGWSHVMFGLAVRSLPNPEKPGFGG